LSHVFLARALSADHHARSLRAIVQGSHSGRGARFVVVHNTSAPDQKTGLAGSQKTASHRREMGADLVGYLPRRNALVGRPAPVHHPGRILRLLAATVPAPIRRPGIRSVGRGDGREFEREPFEALQDNLIAALPILHAAAGCSPRLTSAGCAACISIKRIRHHPQILPRRHLVKADLIADVEAKILACTAAAMSMTRRSRQRTRRPLAPAWSTPAI